MSLTIETLKELRKTELTKAVEEQLMDVDLLTSSLVAVPDGVKVQNMEAYKKFRDHYQFAFNTSSISDYGNYCGEFSESGSKCFIDAERMIASTTFDLGSRDKPLHQKHVAELTLKKTAAYDALLHTNGDRMSQKDAANFIDDWADNIVVYNQNEEKMSTTQASKRVREITIEQIANRESKVGDFSETQSAFERVEAKNQESIPAEIHFTCQPYRGLSDRAFALRVSILTGGEKPQLSFRAVKLEAHKEDMAEEFKGIIVDLFKDTDLKTFIGNS